MKTDCECRYCKAKIDEYFCSSCRHNFNKCESFHEFDGITLCPKCHPENEKLEIDLKSFTKCSERLPEVDYKNKKSSVKVIINLPNMFPFAAHFRHVWQDDKAYGVFYSLETGETFFPTHWKYIDENS